MSVATLAAVDTSPEHPVSRQQEILALPADFVLESGQVLRHGQLAWQCEGPESAPLVVVLGGISAHRGFAQPDGRGWWQSQFGTGRAVDTQRYRVLGIDWLGGAGASSGARTDTGLLAISTSDQARALLLLLNRLGVRQVHALIGASYGGSVAQHLAALLGPRLRRLVVLCAAHRSSQYALAVRHVQRAILDLGGDGKAALELARSLAVLGYRTPEGIEQRFVDDDVLGWLGHHGRCFAGRFDTDAYRCLGASLDTHRIDPESIRVPTTLFNVREDQLVPSSLAHEFAARCGAGCDLVEVSSVYGHDAFLKEDAAVACLFRNALQDVAA